MQQPVNAMKRTMWMWILSLAWVSTAVSWSMTEALGQSSSALRLILGINIVFHPVMFFIVRRRLLAPRRIDFICLLFGVGLCAISMALVLYSPVYGSRLDLQPLYLWIPILYVFAFTLADYRSSLKLSLAILGLFVLVSLPYLAHAPQPHTNFTIQLHIVSAVLIAGLYFFASYQQRFQLAQLTVEELARMANTDELTGLANRRRMLEAIESELRRFARYGHQFSIILIDIDHFKTINDQFGHIVGDQVLMALARRSSEALREVDVMGRWGGEEFLVSLPETSYEQSMQKAEELCRHVAAASMSGGHSITISCGVTTASNGDDINSLLRRADMALYAAKRGGRNCAEGVLADQDDDLIPFADKVSTSST